MKGWKIYLNSQHVDTVFYSDNLDKDYVESSLLGEGINFTEIVMEK